MSLDTVELLMEVEEKFNIVIPDIEAESIVTVKDFSTSVYNKIQLQTSPECLSQIIFYRIRMGFLLFGNLPSDVTPESKIVDLLPGYQIVQEWNILEKTIKLKLPELVKMDKGKHLSRELILFGVIIRKRIEPISESFIRKLVDWVISLNYKQLIDLRKLTTIYEIERIICGIISDSQGIPVNEIELNHAITNDLGID